MDPVEVRRRIGMVFQKPNPFPKTIYKNVAWGPSINGFRGDLDELVETSLKKFIHNYVNQVGKAIGLMLPLPFEWMKKQ